MLCSVATWPLRWCRVVPHSLRLSESICCGLSHSIGYDSRNCLGHTTSKPQHHLSSLQYHTIQNHHHTTPNTATQHLLVDKSLLGEGKLGGVVVASGLHCLLRVRLRKLLEVADVVCQGVAGVVRYVNVR